MSSPSPLERLLSSRARAALVRWAVEDGAPVSVGSLARQLGFTPAGLRREVRGLADLGLLRVVRHGSTDVVQVEADLPLRASLAGLLEALEGQPRRRKTAARRVRSELTALGAPLATPPARRPRPAEKVLVDALGLAREDATVLRVLPVVLDRLGSHLDWRRLRDLARAEGRTSELGMLASLTGALTGRPELCDEVAELADGRRTRVRLFHLGPHSLRERALAERRTPDAARRWGFLLNMDEGDLRSILKRHARA